MLSMHLFSRHINTECNVVHINHIYPWYDNGCALHTLSGIRHTRNHCAEAFLYSYFICSPRQCQSYMRTPHNVYVRGANMKHKRTLLCKYFPFRNVNKTAITNKPTTTKYIWWNNAMTIVFSFTHLLSGAHIKWLLYTSSIRDCRNVAWHQCSFVHILYTLVSYTWAKWYFIMSIYIRIHSECCFRDVLITARKTVPNGGGVQCALCVCCLWCLFSEHITHPNARKYTKCGTHISRARKNGNMAAMHRVKLPSTTII